MTTAVTALPSVRPSSSTASTVIDETMRWPFTSTTTLAIASPRRMLTTVPVKPVTGTQLHVNLLTNSRALSATSRQPLSIVSAWPRPLISTISVTPLFFFCFLKEAFAIAQGTV